MLSFSSHLSSDVLVIFRGDLSRSSSSMVLEESLTQIDLSSDEETLKMRDEDEDK